MTSDHAMRGKLALRDAAIAEQAVDWFVRQQAETMPVDDWLAFSDWLGEDERHAAAFDAVVAADGKLDGLDRDAVAASPAAANDPGETWRPRWRPAAPLAAAAAVAAVLAIALWPRGPSFERLETAPGQTRSLALDDTIRVEINGATELSYARGETPVVRIAHGEAAFYINSPRRSKLRVEVGELTLTDRGTSFDVVQDAFGTRVKVGTGKVEIASPGGLLDLAAGQDYLKPAHGGETVVGRFAAADMAGWRSGQLAFRDAPLAMVAADLSRALGAEIAVAPGLTDKRFTGAIPVGADAAKTIGSAAALMDAAAAPKGKGWVIVPR